MVLFIFYTLFNFSVFGHCLKLFLYVIVLFSICTFEASRNSGFERCYPNKVDLLTSLPSVPAGSSLPALPGLCLAAVVPVSLSLPADRWLPVSVARQHPPAAILQLPGKLSAREMQTLPGTRHLRGALASSAWLQDWKRPKRLCCEMYWLEYYD